MQGLKYKVFIVTGGGGVPQSGNLDISIGEVCGAAQVRPAFRLGDLFV
jgi:hypothetical protein